MLIKKSKGGEIDLVVIVADGMLNGLAANCPVCKNASMVTCHGRVRCWGFMNGTTKCQYKCANKDIERFGFQLPAKQVSKDWCQECCDDSHCTTYLSGYCVSVTGAAGRRCGRRTHPLA